MTITATDRPLRVLMIGDSAATGFGTVTWDLGTRLLDQGIDLRLITQNDTGEPVAAPLGERSWSASAIHPAIVIVKGFRDSWKPDACLLIGDYGLSRYIVAQAEEVVRAFHSIPTLHYCPIEGIDLPPNWRTLWSVIKPVAMSEFGAEQMEKILGYRPPMIPHGVDTEVFRPITPSDPAVISEADMRTYNDSWQGGDFKVMTKQGAKVLMQLDPLRRHILRTDRFMPRKNYAVFFRTTTRVMATHDDIDLVVHCRMNDQGGNLIDLATKYPTEIQSRMKFTDGHNTFNGLPRSLLNVLYNAADYYVSPSAEGFGLTIAEAMSCGLPVVAMDFSAVSEVVGDAGKLVPVAHYLDNTYDHLWATPDEDAMVVALTRLVEHPAEARALGDRARHRIQSRYQWDDAAVGFAGLIREAVEEHASVRHTG